MAVGIIRYEAWYTLSWYWQIDKIEKYLWWLVDGCYGDLVELSGEKLHIILFHFIGGCSPDAWLNKYSTDILAV